jgi:hypothetical protein
MPNECLCSDQTNQKSLHGFYGAQNADHPHGRMTDIPQVIRYVYYSNHIIYGCCAFGFNGKKHHVSGSDLLVDDMLVSHWAEEET